MVEYSKDTVHVYEHIDGEEERFLEEELTDELKNRLIAIGSKEIKTKPIKRKKIHKYIMSGAGVLEDCGYIAGPNIPIVVTYGKRWVVDNVERCMGHVRLPKDSSRVKNMQVSKLAEISALSPVEKPIFTPQQVAGHELRWAEDNVKNYPYMLINSITDVNGNEAISGPVGYTRPPAIPPAMAALLQITEGDINDLLGNQQNGEQLVGNISTETAHLIQNRLDMQTFIYLSNFAKAMRRSGEIWLGMAKSVYVEQGRELETIGDNGDRGKVVLMQPMIDPEDDEMEYKNDLSKAKMKVSVDVGPSSSTKKAATVRSLTEVSKYTQDPETLSILNAMIMMNMDGEGISDVRNFFRKKLIRLSVILPNDKEKEDLIDEKQNMPTDPNSEYLTAAAENERAKAVKAQADTIYTQAKTDSERADTLKTMSDIESDKTKQAIDIIDKLGPNVVPRQ